MRALALAALLWPVAGLGAPHIDPPTLERLAERDNLKAAGDEELHNLGARWISGQFTAELDGRAPREHIVEVTEYTGEGTWQTEYHTYRRTADDQPEPIAPPLVSGGYRDPGYLRVVDLDGDGRDELMVVGDTSGGASALDLWRWRDGFVHLMRSDMPGVDYVVADCALFGLACAADAVVAIEPPGESGPPPFSLLVPLDDGLYRPWPVDPGPWLGELMNRLAHGPPLDRPEYVLPAIRHAMDAMGVMPRHAIATQHALQAMHGAMDELHAHSTVVRAMGWPGNAAARPHLRGLLTLPLHDVLRAVVVETLVRVGTDADREGVLALLDRAPVAAGETGETTFAAVVRAFEERRDPRARARAARLVGDATLHDDIRRWVALRALRNHPTAAPDLARLLATNPSPPIEKELVSALWWLAVVDAQNAAWRTPGIAAALRARLDHADEKIRSNVVGPLLAADPDAPTLLRERLTAEPSADLQWTILRALGDDRGAAGRDVARRAVEALVLGRGGRQHHHLIALHGDDTTRAAGIMKAADSSDLDHYVRSYRDRPPAPEAVSATMRAVRAWSTDARWRMRMVAVQIVAILDRDAARPALIAALEDEHVSVRTAAANGLTQPHPDAQRAVLAALERETESYARSAYLDALARQRSPAAMAALVARLDHPIHGDEAERALVSMPDADGLGVGATLAAHAGRTLRKTNGCRNAARLVRTIGASALTEGPLVVVDALKTCPAQRADILTALIGAWRDADDPAVKRRADRYLDDVDPAVSRAAWRR